MKETQFTYSIETKGSKNLSLFFFPFFHTTLPGIIKKPFLKSHLSLNTYIELKVLRKLIQRYHKFTYKMDQTAKKQYLVNLNKWSIEDLRETINLYAS